MMGRLDLSTLFTRTVAAAFQDLMSLGQPKSTLRLILYGFAFVALPLIASLVYTVFYLDRLAVHSQSAVYQAAQAIQGSQMLGDQLTTMERNAQQYLVLADENLYMAYQDTHAQFQQTANDLYSLPLDGWHRATVTQLIADENALFSEVSATQTADRTNEDMATRFGALTDTAQTVLTGSYRMIDREVRAMQQRAARSKQILFWFAAALIPLTLLSVAVFTVLISRPIRQVEQAILELGDGEFDKPVQVSGPQDLQELGRRLDWLRHRLVELEGQKTRFLHHVSHELKTPLAAIREVAELLNDRIIGPLNVQQQEVVQILHGNTLQLHRLIDDLLNFSMVRERTPQLTTRDVNLLPLIEKVISNHKPAMLAKSQVIDTDLESINVMVDEDQITTVIDNLFSNAVKFTPYNGRINVQLRHNGEQALLDVTDSGPGIASTEQDKVFEAFYQSDTPTDSYVKGSGLGLSIAREYIAANGGSIEVRDTGQGASLRVVLPLQQFISEA